MKIRERECDRDLTVDAAIGEHVLVVAEAGFSMLDIYARGQHGVPVERIRDFADEVNRRNEAGSLFPAAPVSALPRKYLRGEADPSEVFRHVCEFLVANEETMHASRLLIDLRIGPDRVPEEAVDACREALEIVEPSEVKFVWIVL
ncbi:MAG: hypothetical protein P4L85_14140 [Paludisphaera borealis]|uniref:hypothetical protein n=1 Tax=Paludisphaera borealis TaxID=1387353 RepID=UPI00283FAD2B|nr:hypothetical protein [Paludisphaera borealis]MDR3620487.1 hypothetical protein [Paludisphaera borealis]